MSEENLFYLFVSRLNAAHISYMVTGAVASIIYGEPRLTHDIDIVVELNEDQVDKITGAFPLEEFYCPPPEVIKLEIKRSLRGHFNLIHHDTGFKADMYLLGQDDLHHWAMSRRKAYHTEGGGIWLAPVEYVILRKLMYYQQGGSEKHLEDISGILAVSSEEIDKEQLEEKIKQYNLAEMWEKARNKIIL